MRGTNVMSNDNDNDGFHIYLFLNFTPASTVCSGMENFLERFLAFCSCALWFMEVVQVDAKSAELKCQLEQVDNRRGDMILQLNEEEANNPCRKRKHIVDRCLERMGSFKAKAKKTLETCEEQRKLKRIFMARHLDKHLRDGQHLLGRADQLHREGLTRYVVCTRGVRLPVDDLIGNTANEQRENGLQSIKTRARIIGIHGNLGSGKTNLMKFLHNDVFDDPKHFKAVFWATAPEEQPDVKGIQECVAEAMKFKFEDEDVVRRASLLAKRLKDMAPGHVVLFLDNVKEQFLTHEVGIPVGVNEAEDLDFCCTLVFTATSEDVCNRMRCCCKLKMDLLPEEEARELFLYEAGLNSSCTQSYNRMIQKVADDVAWHCARMPLVITMIARSMTGKEDICEWRNRLNELMGVVGNMHGDEAKILEQLKFCSNFNCLKDETIRLCFLFSAKLLPEGREMSSQVLIRHWTKEGLIGKSHCRGSRVLRVSSATNDQGHTIINKLQRVYLLEVVKRNRTEIVKMNKWIRKMAEII